MPARAGILLSDDSIGSVSTPIHRGRRAAWRVRARCRCSFGFADGVAWRTGVISRQWNGVTVMTAVERGRYCRSCGYPLFGLETRECPECGRSFDAVNRRTTDPYPGFSRYRRWTVAVLCAFAATVAGVIALDRYVLEPGGTRWEHCAQTGAIRSVTLSRIFGSRLGSELHFRPDGFDSDRTQWEWGITAAVTGDPLPPGSILVMEKDGAFGAFRFGALERNDEGQLFVIGAYAWRPDRGALADRDGSVNYGMIGLSARASRDITFGPFSVYWSESDDSSVFFYYERFFGDARPGDTRMAVLRPADGYRFEQLRYDDVADLLRATRTDGLPGEHVAGDQQP